VTITQDGNFYQKKIVTNGPGFASVTITSSSVIGGNRRNQDPLKDIINSFFGMVGQINQHLEQVDKMINGPPSPEDANALAVPNGGGFLADTEEPEQ
jgi:hypothetical protein